MKQVSNNKGANLGATCWYPKTAMSLVNADRSCLYAEGGSRVITVPESMSVPAVEKMERLMGSKWPPTLMPVMPT